MFTIKSPPTMTILPPAELESRTIDQNSTETYFKITGTYVDGTVITLIWANGGLSISSNKPLVYDETEKAVRVQTADDVRDERNPVN